MKNFRLWMIGTGVIEAAGFVLLFLSALTSGETDFTLVIAGVVIVLAGSTIGAAALFVRAKEHESKIKYPAGDIQDVVFFDS